MKKFLKSNGYYLILIVCVFAVCIAGIAILEHNSKDDTSTLLSNTEQASADEYNAVPTVTAPQSTSNQSSAANGGSTSVSKPIKPNDNAPAETNQPEEKLSLLKPVSGKVLVEFSDKKLVYNKTLKEWKVHPAIDIEGKKGEDIICAMTGTVSDIKTDPLYGTTVIIDNGSGTKTVYCGIAAMNDITLGKQVTAGSVLGTLGDTIFCESETGTHLHFEVIQNGKKIDPVLLFPKETSADVENSDADTTTQTPGASSTTTTMPTATATASATATSAPTATMNILQPRATSVG
ncbi:MAG: M23 family metallopeptidase [Clostridia bacterium]|nr:M23 family metallopeptidase [Clostridia bacterium]